MIRLLSIACINLLLCLSSLSTMAAEEVYLGQRVVSKDDFIRLLIPTASTRGITLNQPSNETAETVTQAQTATAEPIAVSMDIRFAFDSFALTDDAMTQLQPLGEALGSPELNGMTFLLEGHTDAKGSDDYNLVLSYNRAESVKQYLVSQFNVVQGRLVTSGKGEYLLLDANNPSSGINRRVAIMNITN
jgi:outer membrane protein OmpA-like peptidoglycan-associated protein